METSKYRDLFVQEAIEHAWILNDSLLKLEKSPTSLEYVDVMFRSAHTLKGIAATMGYDGIAQLSKAIEDVLQKLKGEQMSVSEALVSSLLRCFDALEIMINDESKVLDLTPYLKELESPLDQNRNSVESSFISNVPSIRVKQEDLDSLVNLVGELMITKMRLERVKHLKAIEDDQDYGTMGKLISNLQYQTMKLRMTPIHHLFNRFPRHVRDLSTSLGKKTNLKIEGSELEIDRSVIDVLSDPMLHILRNAVDHGIESPVERASAGKPEWATIRLAAFRTGDRVAIEVSDDGKGIDIEKIRSTAVEKSIISAEKAELMTDDEVLSLLGTPGLTTTKDVTSVSGRGVGFDIVRHQVEGIGGQVKIKTKKNKGTTIILDLPLSLAVIRGLVVRAGIERYVLPLAAVATTLRIDSNGINRIHGSPAIMHRDQVVQLQSLANILDKTLNNELAEGGSANIVVIEKGEKLHGLVVDAVEGSHDIVVKRLEGAELSKFKFSTATILPDGRVAIILDPILLLSN